MTVPAKTAARKAAFARRAQAQKAVPPGAAQDRLAALLAGYAGRVLAGYLPIGSEIDPTPVMAAYPGPVCVPVIPAPGQALRFRAWAPGAALIEGPFGVPVPAEGDWLVPEVLIVPLLAFDARGFRLGYGGGYYDRTLENLRARGPVTAVGFAYSAQEAADLPVEATDQKLDLVVSDAGVRHFA